MSKSKLTTACGTVTNFLREVKGEYDKYVENKATPQSRFALQARLEELEDIFASAKLHHMLIVASTEPSEVKTSYLEKEIFGTLKELYFEYMATLKEALDTLNVSKETAGPTISSDFKLPAIKIPLFGGNYESWPEFSNLFKSIVHDNNTLSKVQKLHYLKANVSDEAVRLLQHLVINEKNYDSAWTILTTRYEHKRLLVNCQLRLFCNQAKLHNEDVKGIKALLDTTNECVQSLRNLEVPVHQWDAIIIHLMIQKLPSQTQGLWEEHLGSSKALPDFADFTEFLTNRYRTLEAIGQIAKIGQGPSYKKISLHTKENDHYSCALCNGSHSMRRCSKFLAADPRKRQEITRQHHFCFNCLARGHDSNNCSSQFKCAECQGQHHTLLHIQANNARGFNTSYQPNRNGQQIQRPRVPQPSTSQNCNAYVREQIQIAAGGRPEKKQPTVLLATMLVNAMDQSGKLITLRALLDPGSEASYITESAIELLKLRKTKQITEIGGIGGVSNCCSKASALDSLHSLMDHDFGITIQVLVLPRLTAWLPSKKMDKSEWPHISGLALADPQFNQTNKIDILLGSDVYPEISLQGLIKGKYGTPMAQQTVFGWVLIGPVFEGNRVTNALYTQTENVEGILQRFWEIEQDPQNLVFTREEEDCESHFCETHERLLDGRYKVSLPFKEGRRPQMGRSYNSALARFLQLEKRFKTNPDFAHKYKQGMEEYFELDQIEEVPNVQLINAHQHYYLPHHAVMKESSSTTKLRIVFDASCPTSDGSSLNDHLLTGPKQQDNIIDHILRFRKHRVAFVADINKMYRQIWIVNQDAMYQLILWRRREDQEVKTFRLKTVTFGTAAAPFLAIRTLHQLAADEGNDFPLAATIAENNFYVDDVIHGVDSIPEANRMREELMRMMSLGGFPLRKWASNSNEFLKAIPAEFRELELPLFFNEKDCIKTLGIQWHPARDIFTFKSD